MKCTVCSRPVDLDQTEGSPFCSDNCKHTFQVRAEERLSKAFFEDAGMSFPAGARNLFLNLNAAKA